MRAGTSDRGRKDKPRSRQRSAAAGELRAAGGAGTAAPRPSQANMAAPPRSLLPPPAASWRHIRGAPATAGRRGRAGNPEAAGESGRAAQPAGRARRAQGSGGGKAVPGGSGRLVAAAVGQRLWRSARGTLDNYRHARAARSRTELRPRRRWRRTRLRVSAGGAAAAPPCSPPACAARRGGTRAAGGKPSLRLCAVSFRRRGSAPRARGRVRAPRDTCGSPAGPCAHRALRALGKWR